jgi:predicted chitinase
VCDRVHCLGACAAPAQLQTAQEGSAVAQILTSSVVADIFQIPQSLADEVTPQLLVSMAAFQINTPAAMTCYFVQCMAESQGLYYFAELGDQSYFMHYDPQGNDPTLAASLGNIYPGDGYAFRGSGPIQVTGRSNFEQAQAAMRALGLTGPDGSPLDITTLPSSANFGPDLVRTHRYGFVIAAWWWHAHGGNEVAQRQPLSWASESCGRLVNEGNADSSGVPQGEQNRLDAFARISAMGDFQFPTSAKPGLPTGSASNPVPVSPAPAPAPTGDWSDMATKEEVQQAVRDAQPVEVFFVRIGNSIYEHDVKAGTKQLIPNVQTLNDRKYVLTIAGIKWAPWDGGKAVSNPRAFGKAI